MKHLFTTMLICLVTGMLHVTIAQNYDLLVNSGEAITKGIEAHDKGEYEDAIKQYNLVFEGDTNYVLALYEKALSLNANEQFKEAITTSEKALSLPHSEYSMQFYNILNNAYDSSEEHEKALVTINEGIKIYPNAYLLHYNKGVSLEMLDRFDDALASYQKAISLNPIHFNSHFKIGELAARKGAYTKATLALCAALTANPTHANSLSALKVLDDMLNVTYEAKAIEVDLGKDDFSDIDQIIESKVAIDDKYKTGSSIKFALINQIHAMLELLNDQSGNKGWFAKRYIPYFMSIKKENQFKPFSEYLFVPSTNADIQKKLNKNIKDLKAFQAWSAQKWVDLNKTVEREGKQLTQSFHEVGTIGAVGEMNGDLPIGFWQYFYTNSGNVAAAGTFDKKGKQGEWKYFHSNGTVREKTEYKDGKAEGTFFYYDIDGNLIQEGFFKDDKRNGQFTYYDIFGCKRDEDYFENGVLNGPFTSFYRNGKASVKGNLKDGVLDGKYTRYYEDGSIKEESTYKNGDYEGYAVQYYNNGNKRGEYNYVEGVLNGDYKLYYSTGELNYTSNYVKGNESGLAKSYYKDGSLESEGNYDESGKKNGIETSFNKSGTKVYEQVYKKGEVISYQFFDKDGKVLSEGKKKNNQFFVDNRLPDNTKVAEGNFAVGDKGKDGLWKYYTDYGQLESETEYDNGKVKGIYKDYNALGNIETEVKMVKENPLTEWITNYQPNGKVLNNGWKVNEQYEGKWEYFHPNGKMSSSSVYLNGKLNGPTYSYDFKGKLHQKDVYEADELIETHIYDTLGQVIQSLNFKNNQPTAFTQKNNFGKKSQVYTKLGDWYAGNYQRYYGNGTLAIKGKYENNNVEGKWEYFNTEGKLSNINNFDKGYMEGKQIRYYADEGKIKYESTYSNGKENGPYIGYSFKNKIDAKVNYTDGIRDDKSEIFDPNGVLQMVRYYNKDGKVIGYSYNGADGELVDMIPIPADGSITIDAKFPNGKTARKYTTVHNHFNGTYKQFYENGQVSEISNYKMDYKHGLFQEFAEDGTLLKESTYEYDLLQGPYKTFYPNGQLKKELNYIDGLLHGEELQFDETGNKTLKRIYYNDIIIEETIF